MGGGGEWRWLGRAAPRRVWSESFIAHQPVFGPGVAGMPNLEAGNKILSLSLSLFFLNVKFQIFLCFPVN